MRIKKGVFEKQLARTSDDPCLSGELKHTFYNSFASKVLISLYTNALLSIINIFTIFFFRCSFFICLVSVNCMYDTVNLNRREIIRNESIKDRHTISAWDVFDMHCMWQWFKSMKTKIK